MLKQLFCLFSKKHNKGGSKWGRLFVSFDSYIACAILRLLGRVHHTIPRQTGG